MVEVVDDGGREVTGVVVRGSEVILTLDGNVQAGQMVTVSYARPAFNRIQDKGGTPAEDFSNEAVANRSPVSAPRLDPDLSTVAGTKLTLVYDEALDPSSEPPTDSFRVNGARDITDVMIEDNSVKLTLATEIQDHQVVNVSYTPPASNPIQDKGGTDAGRLTNYRVSNSSPMRAPWLVSAVVDGKALTLVYNEALDRRSEPAVSTFTVWVDGTPHEVIHRGVTGSSVRLTLKVAVLEGQVVTVSYTPPASNPIQDIVQNPAPGLDGEQVDNETPVEAPAVTKAVPPSSNRGGGGGGGGGGGFDEGEEEPITASEQFTDISAGVWYESAVSWMILHQVTSGCTRTMFCPGQNLTRQQFVTFLWRAAGKPIAPYLGSEAFTDVRKGVYAEQSIGWAVANGVTKGCTSGQYGDPDWQFCPTQPVTRGQMSTLLYRHVEADYVGAAPPYIDVEPEMFFTTSISWLTDFQVVPGCAANLFCPDRDATRAEAALFINGVAIRPHIWGPGNTSFIPQP